MPQPSVTTGTLRVLGACLSAVLLVGVGTATSAATSPPSLLGASPVAAPATARQSAVRLSAEVAPTPVTLRPVAPRPAARQPAVRPTTTPMPAVAARPVKRWLPSGTGMWLHEFGRSEGGDPRAVVARARQAGLSTLYVQTGSTKKGWIGTPTLRALLPATKGTGLSVVAWDFPTLLDPEADALRLARAAAYRCGAGCPRVAAVAPDIETAAEGTRVSVAAVTRYYLTLRRALPPGIAILATVPWPSENRTGSYPYARTAALADAVLPMTYWYNRSPYGVTATSMAYLRGFGKPVMPVGQGYDGRIDAPHLLADPDPGRSVAAFLAAARAGGATAVSLWSWQTTGLPQWAALSASELARR